MTRYDETVRYIDGRKERMPRWLRCALLYFVPLILLATLVFVLWLRHHHEGEATRVEQINLLIRVGEVQYLVVAFLLLFTRRWTLQALGLLALSLGGGQLKFRFIGMQGQQPVQEWERDLTVALFESANLLLILSFIIVAVGTILRRLRRWRNSPEDATLAEQEDECS